MTKYILKIIIIILFLNFNYAYSQNKVWFKPKAVDDSLKIDKDKCLAITGAKDGSLQMANCLTQEGWTYIDLAVIKADEGQCIAKSKEDSQNMRKVFLACMLSKGWDLLSKSEEIISKLNQDIRDICTKDEYKDYYKNTPCNTNDITFEQLANNSKITENEKKILLEITNKTDVLTRQQDEARKLYGGYIDKKYAEFRNDVLIPEITSYRLDLYNGKITWGQYNQKRKDNMKEANEKLKQLREDLQNYLKTKS